MKQEKRLAIIKASIQSLEERYPDLNWKAFKNGLPELTTYYFKTTTMKSPQLFIGRGFTAQTSILVSISKGYKWATVEAKATANGYKVYNTSLTEYIFTRILNRLTLEPLKEELKEEINSLLFTVIMYTWQNQSKLEKALNI